MNKIVTGFLILISTGTQAQQFSKEQVIQDLNLLVSHIESYNPALSTYSPDFNKEAAEIIASVEDNFTIVDCYRIINRIGKITKEGHFTVDTKEVFAGILNNTYQYLPLQTKIISDKIYIWKTFTGKEILKRGDEILSINNKPTANILQQLYKHIPTDGDITTYTRLKASDGFFWMYYFFIEQPEAFEITYRPLNSQAIKKAVLPALTRSEQVKNLRSNPNYEAPKPSTPTIQDFYALDIQKNYAYLHLKSFDFRLVDKYKIDAEKFYEEIFKDLNEKNIRHLIIDVRNNTGGRKQFPNGIPAFILQTERTEFLRQSISWKGKKATKKLPKKSKFAFQGKIYGLVNGLTFSSGATFARHLKEYGNATIIGEETGSRYEGFAAGSSQEIILPNSGIKVFIPRYHIIFPASKKQATQNRGLMPDIEVINYVSDEISAKDVVLEKAIELINE